MLRWCQLLLWLLCAGATWPAQGAARDWPRLVSTAYHPECMAALRMAYTEFHSTKPELTSPEPALADFAPSLLIVARSESDLSTGDALRVALGVFYRLPGNERYRSFLWQIEPVGDQRLVIEEERFGWRGDAYNVRLVDAHFRTDDYLVQRRDDRSDQHRNLISRAWNPPLVFHDPGTQRLWFIHFDPWHDAFGRWEVYLPGNDGYQAACHIEFAPQATRPDALLPPSLRRLGAQLDAAMGGGRDEGTAQPTGQLLWRAQVARLNAIFRPWVTPSVYTSREEVDAGLQTWMAASKTNPRLEAQYRQAEAELARHYEREFKMPGEVARTRAAEVMDAVFCAPVVFGRIP